MAQLVDPPRWSVGDIPLGTRRRWWKRNVLGRKAGHKRVRRAWAALSFERRMARYNDGIPDWEVFGMNRRTKHGKEQVLQ